MTTKVNCQDLTPIYPLAGIGCRGGAGSTSLRISHMRNLSHDFRNSSDLQGKSVQLLRRETKAVY